MGIKQHKLEHPNKIHEQVSKQKQTIKLLNIFNTSMKSLRNKKCFGLAPKRLHARQGSILERPPCFSHSGGTQGSGSRF